MDFPHFHPCHIEPHSHISIFSLVLVLVMNEFGVDLKKIILFRNYHYKKIPGRTPKTKDRT